MTNNELWKCFKEDGDLKAKEKLIIHYISLVKNISGRLYNSYNAHVEYDDLVGYGIIGLLDAVEKFDYKLGNKFETYANIRIRGSIVDQLRSLDWIPRSMRQKYKNLEKATKKLQNIYGMEIKDEYLAKAEYEKIIEIYGEQRPFTNIIKAEETHISLLKPLFEAYDVDLKSDNAKEYVIVPESIEAALKVGVQAEIENIEMYEKFLEQDLPEDVKDVFERLMNASKNHLKAFENGVDRGNGIGRGSENGRGNQRVNGRGSVNGSDCGSARSGFGRGRSK